MANVIIAYLPSRMKELSSFMYQSGSKMLDPIPVDARFGSWIVGVEMSKDCNLIAGK
jgi:hypothetical protein